MSVDNNPPEIVKVIDTLMEELDQLASNPQTSSDELFARALDLLKTVIQPASCDVFLLGPDELPCNLTGSEKIEDYFSNWGHVREEIATSKHGFHSQPSKSLVGLAFGLQPGATLQGVLVATVAPAQRNKSTLSLMKAVADLISRYLGGQIKQVSLQEDFLHRVNEFSLGCLSSLKEHEVAKIIANDARMLLGCERVQYFRVSGNRCTLTAVSSVAVFEKRTELLRCSTQLAKATVRHKAPLVSSQTSDDKKIQAAMQTYGQLSGMPFFALFPLQAKFRNRKPARPGGVLLIEYAQTPPFLEFVRGAKIVVPQAGLAAFNAKKVSSIPFHHWLIFLSDSMKLGGLFKLLTAVALMMGLLFLAFLIPTDFKVRMNGTLRPVTQRLVFSPHDAFVGDVLVKHGDAVTAGDLLVKLRSPALNLELEEAIGEIAKLTEFKAAKAIALNQISNRSASNDPSLQAKLASEIADLEFQIATFADKQTYVQRRIDELSVSAPISGKVVTWNVQKMLMEKPVRWGDPLLKIADEESGWELRFKASENKVGYLLEAIAQHPDDLPVEYFFQSNPDQKFTTVIRKTADSTEMDPEVGPSVAVLCDIAPEQQLKRHGAKVVGDVVCGKRSIAYVWTYELVDAIRRQFVW